MEDIHSPGTSDLTDSLESTCSTCLYVTLTLHFSADHSVNKNLTELCQMSSDRTRLKGYLKADYVLKNGITKNESTSA